ncbi:MAG: energy transducer TonB, partial [Ignavibacteria bacterium]|nr:energy transducer TonB [Ignavibacteria bacterium]
DEQTIATQAELSQQVSPVTTDIGGATIEKNIDVKAEDINIDDGPPADFVPFEKGPEIIKQVVPEYPDLARRANLEGKVWVKIWVDKEGKPRKAEVIKSDAEIFNEPAVKAAMQFLFTPAMMNNGPVAVWVTIPFKFNLRGESK